MTTQTGSRILQSTKRARCLMCGSRKCLPGQMSFDVFEEMWELWIGAVQRGSLEPSKRDVDETLRRLE
jgi:hypothetical protein